MFLPRLRPKAAVQSRAQPGDNLSMRPARDRSALSLLVMGAALSLLLLLAFLQYQWIGRLSQAEHERLQAHLRAAVFRFTQEFNGELARLPVMLSLGRPAPPERDLAELAERYQNWRDAAPHPELVRRFYVARGGAAGVEEILVYNTERAQFEPTGWPERLAPVRARLQLRAGEEGRPVFALFRGMLDEEGRVLVVPCWRGNPRRGMRSFEPRPERAFDRFFEPLGWAIAELDTEFIVRDLLPELVDRHFRRAQGFDFQIQVVRRADRRVLFRSDSSVPSEPLASPDAAAGLLELRLAPARGLGEGGPLGEAATLASGLPAPARAESEGRWQVLVKHRAGSLEAAVDQVRWRNLGVSFGILLLMAASLAMLIVSTQRAHRLARLQMEFVAGVSHELRTPLAVICSAGDNLADGLVIGGEQTRRYGALIRQEGRRLTEMVEQILTFAGAQAGRLKFHFQPVDVGEVVRRATLAMESEASKAGVVIETDIEAETPWAIADPVALGQCLRNLLGNALKYGASGRWVGVRVRRGEDGRTVELRVEDRGPGIAAADLPHIFEPFYRGRNATEAQVHGAGLGLSLVKGVVEAHRGTIRVESRPGEGTRFMVRLPAADSEAVAARESVRDDDAECQRARG